MGWASGSSILEDVAQAVMPLIPKGKRKEIAERLVAIFEDADCDTINEVEQKDIRAVYDAKYPPDEEE